MATVQNVRGLNTTRKKKKDPGIYHKLYTNVIISVLHKLQCIKVLSFAGRHQWGKKRYHLLRQCTVHPCLLDHIKNPGHPQHCMCNYVFCGKASTQDLMHACRGFFLNIYSTKCISCVRPNHMHKQPSEPSFRTIQ